MEKLIKISVFGPKWAIFDSFCPGKAKMGFFGKKRKCHFRTLFRAATLCKKPEQTYERILRSSSEELTDERTDKSEFVGPNSAPRGTKNSKIL